MELELRCAVPDRPGALAALAGAIARAGGDIEAVDVVEAGDGRALDDLTVIVDERNVPALLDRVRALEGVELVHAGPSRGHPSDGVARLAVALEALLDGAMSYDHAVATLVGGLLRARSATFSDADGAPPGDGKTLVLALGDRCLVVRRDYRFTRIEQERAAAILRVCSAAGHTGAHGPSASGARVG